MKIEEIINSHKEQVNISHKMIAEIEIKSKQMADRLSSLYNISVGLVQLGYNELKVNSDEWKCREEQRVSRLKEAINCHQEIDKNLKKLVELMKVPLENPKNPVYDCENFFDGMTSH